jgi:arylsulfatase A
VPGGPLDRGFEYYFGDDVPNFPPYGWIENDRLLATPSAMYAPDPVPEEGNHEGRPGPMTPGWRLDAVMPRLTERAVSWIAEQKNSDKPFFLYFPWTSPHAPIVPAPEFQGKTEAGPYGDFVHQSDGSAGQVLRALEENGFGDNTLVIFTSDNGPEHYAYDRVRQTGHRSMGPLRGLKRDIYEGGHRVPFVVRWPGVIAPGSVCDALISQLDLMRTIAAIIGFDLPDGAAEDSCNLLPLIQGHTPKQPVRETHIHNTVSNRYAIRQGDWVLINANSGAHSKTPEWYDEENGYEPNPHAKALYNIREDISQRKNLIDDLPEKASELAALLQSQVGKRARQP